MGQNQDKLEGGEQALGEGSEEAKPGPDSGAAGSHSGDVMEGRSSCEEEEEAGNSRKNLEEPDAQDLDGSRGQEPTTPSSEKHINVWVSPFAAREVRQGGAVGKEGAGGGGGGGRTAPLETDKNLKSSVRIEERAGAQRLFNQPKREKKTEVQLQTSSKIKMEHQNEGSVQLEEIQEEDFSAEELDEESGPAATSGDAIENTEEDSVRMKMSRCEDLAGSESLLSVQQNQHGTIMAEVEDVKLCTGTVERLRARKEPPTAQPQHPLKNTLQKESLLDLSDTIDCRPPKKRTENNTKEEACEVKQVLNLNSSTKPKVTETDDQRESAGPNQQMDTTETTTNQKIDLPAVEPSSILIKLLRRDRKETTELSTDKIQQSDVNTSSSVCDRKGLKEKLAEEKHATKDPHVDMKQTEMYDTLTSDCLQSQPGVIGNTMCENSLIKSLCPKDDCQIAGENINSAEASINEDMEIKENLSSDNLQSAVSHERTSCEVSIVMSEEFAPLSRSDSKSPPTKRDGQSADSCNVLIAEKTDTRRPPLQVKSDRERPADLQLSGSACSDAQPVRRRKVKNSTEDTVLVAAGTVISEESLQIMKEDLNMKLKANTLPQQPDEQPGKKGNDGVSVRDKSQGCPKSRAVSALIMETIQLHEKLQQHDRPKSAEVKCDEQGHSVKVAQMKAAFDSAQKSPDKAIERKPSMRKADPLRARQAKAGGGTSVNVGKSTERCQQQRLRQREESSALGLQEFSRLDTLWDAEQVKGCQSYPRVDSTKLCLGLLTIPDSSNCWLY
ncbi:Pentatricopeptide repeat-containing protein chloroplastic [Dissostichus eleginoides]|uniref:Pentatricopeptide repeat-containing protein chloroplastic n=1 Tax=Dissostichus eleginoides TaxID=100907 RepID=A0AAD9BYW7_DISEL|nr:Pentatricopeptide repeat-containing protein chloroplastic [Dissostichus eleginoides]